MQNFCHIERYRGNKRARPILYTQLITAYLKNEGSRLDLFTRGRHAGSLGSDLSFACIFLS